MTGAEATVRKEAIAPRILDLGELVEDPGPMLAAIVGEDIRLDIVAPRRLGSSRPGSDDGLTPRVFVRYE